MRRRGRGEEEGKERGRGGKEGKRRGRGGKEGKRRGAPPFPRKPSRQQPDISLSLGHAQPTGRQSTYLYFHCLQGPECSTHDVDGGAGVELPDDDPRPPGLQVLQVLGHITEN